MASAKRRRQRDLRLLEESAATLTQVSTDLVVLDVDEAALRKDGTVGVRIITPGWGASGYYSADVLEAAAGAQVFPAGTQMYWDHPTATERADRPERSLRDLAAVTETAARWDANHPQGAGLYAQVKVFEAFRPLLAEMAPHIGVSIRAAAEVVAGEAEGRRGRIVERIVEGKSVDFVTQPGRGGKVLAILEAAGRTDLAETRNVGEWFQSRVHLDFTTRADDMFGEGRLTKDERISLSNAIGAALDAFATTVEELAPQLLTRDLWDDPAATTNTTESHQEDEMTPEEIKEAVAAAVKAEVTPIQTELAETKTKLEKAEADLAEAKTTGSQASEALLVTAAEAHVSANDKVKGLPAVTQARIVESLAKAATFKDGTTELDVTKLDEAIKATVDAEVKYLAEATGSPVSGVGGGDGTPPATVEVIKEADDALEAAFKRAGLSDGAAKVATAGRA